MISQFYLKTPITELHVLLDNYVHELLHGEFAGFKCKRFLHVPVSEVIAQDAQLRLIQQGVNAAGVKFGKIAILLTSRDDYRPLGALIISVDDDHNDVSEATASALQYCNIWTSCVTKDNYREQTRVLLTNCNEKPIQFSESANIANQYERRAFKEILANVPPDFLKFFQENWRPMLQVGISGVIDAVKFGEDYQPSRQERNLTTVEEFNNLNKTPHGRQIRNHILNDFSRRSSFDLIFVGKESNWEMGRRPSEPFWWPQLAVEIDGPHHGNAKNVLSDHKKDTLCILAGLPLMRVNLTKMGREATEALKPGIWSSDESAKAHWDYFRFMVAKSMRTFAEFRKHQIEFDRELKLWLNVKALEEGGMDFASAISQAVADDHREHETEDSDAMGDRYAEEMQKQSEKQTEIDQFQERFGKEPVFDIHIDEYDVLHGRLGNFRLPPLKSFCRIAGRSDINELRIEFAEAWLIREALN